LPVTSTPRARVRARIVSVVVLVLILRVYLMRPAVGPAAREEVTARNGNQKKEQA
jgi:hypothetical protein